MGSNLKVKVKETHGGDDFKPKPPAGVGDCGTAEAKGKQKERGLSKVEARRYRYALSSYTSLLDNTAILVYGLRKLRNAKEQ